MENRLGFPCTELSRVSYCPLILVKVNLEFNSSSDCARYKSLARRLFNSYVFSWDINLNCPCEKKRKSSQIY